MDRKKKSAKQIERHFKGVANHHRIDILLLVSETPRLTVDQIAKSLNKNFKTTSEHIRRLVQAGLINKEYEGRHVAHFLSVYGKEFVKFTKYFQTFQHS
ncbi:MAG: winged helix-turn-helix domain-containing protein [Patescibacteria group bacterium]